MAGIKMLHVPYKGTALSILDRRRADADAGRRHVQAQPHVKGGKLKPLAVTDVSARRC